MAILNPIYLDLQLLQNLADVAGIEVAGEVAVTRRRLDARSGKAGIDKLVALGGEKSSSDEVTEEFKTTFRPVRLLNDVLALVDSDGLATDLVGDPRLPIAQRDTVQLAGDLTISPVTFIGAVTSTFNAILEAQASAPGGVAAPVDPAVLQRSIFDRSDTTLTQIIDVECDVPDTRVVIVADPASLFGTATVDDLECDLTVLGSVTRVVMPGETYPLDRYLLPNMSKSMRRSMIADGLPKQLPYFSELLGVPLDERDLSLIGPAVLITPIALY